MYYNKFESGNSVKKERNNLVEMTNKGAQGIIDSTSFNYEQSIKKANKLTGYPSKRELAIASEHKRETDIFKKVLVKKKR